MLKSQKNALYNYFKNMIILQLYEGNTSFEKTNHAICSLFVFQRLEYQYKNI